jgi:uncharacterized membrane protein
MSLLFLGIAIFFGIHLVPSFVDFRSRLIDRIGAGAYKGVYSIIALIGLILIGQGMSKAEYQPIWEPPFWGGVIAVVVMPLSFYLFATAYMKSNIKRFLRHPMLLGVLLWSGVHLLTNGDLASLVLFGSFAVFSLFAMFSANRRGALYQKEKYPFSRDVMAITTGLVAYAVFLFLHPYLIGAPVI